MALANSTAQIITLLTLVIHFLHCLLCLSNYLDWVRHQEDEDKLGVKIVRLYLALTIIAVFSYLFVSSVFYVWAWRYSSCEDTAKRRRIWGIAVNLLFADFPLFCVQVDIVWNVGFATGLQALSFLFTCLSFGYSAFRVWLFAMVRVIKRAQPPRTLGDNTGIAMGGGELPPMASRRGGLGTPPEYTLTGGGRLGAADTYVVDYEGGLEGPRSIRDPSAMMQYSQYDSNYSVIEGRRDGSPQRAGGIIPSAADPAYVARAYPPTATPAEGIIPSSALQRRT